MLPWPIYNGAMTSPEQSPEQSCIGNQFILTVFHDPGVHADGAAYETEADMQAAMERVGKFNQELQESGKFVFACGLTPPEAASQVTAGGTATPGPVGQGPYVGGFWVVKASSTKEAHDIAAKAAEACGQPLEVRSLQG